MGHQQDMRYDCTTQRSPTAQPASCCGSYIKAHWEELHLPVHVLMLLLLVVPPTSSTLTPLHPSPLLPPFTSSSSSSFCQQLSFSILFPLSFHLPYLLLLLPVFLLHLLLPTNHLLLRVNTSVIIITGLCVRLWENALRVSLLYSQQLSENMMSGMRTLGQKVA